MAMRSSRRALRLVALGVGVVVVWGMLHWPVHTRQGVDFQVTEYTVPFYLKLTRFLYRHMEYRHLVREVTAGTQDPEEKVLRIYDWVRSHIHSGVPEDLRIVDDHVWHIIVRGYGTSDQLADVLATLCVYAGVPAQLVFLGPPQSRSVYAMAMVKLDHRWRPIDPYGGVLVRTADGHLASREEILGNLELARRVAPELTIRGIPYAELYQWLPDIQEGAQLRPYFHQPLIRVWYEMRQAVEMVHE